MCFPIDQQTGGDVIQRKRLDTEIANVLQNILCDKKFVIVFVRQHKNNQ
jgi:hypothetical protein